MKCPKCGGPLVYEDCITQEYDDTTLYERWKVHCFAYNCDFEGKLWITYREEKEEWDNEESTGETSCVH